MREHSQAEMVSQQQIWENQLDDMGTEAGLERLEAHMAKAPNPESEAAIHLQGVVAGLRLASLRTLH